MWIISYYLADDAHEISCLLLSEKLKINKSVFCYEYNPYSAYHNYSRQHFQFAFFLWGGENKLDISCEYWSILVGEWEALLA